jgi:Rrf2 family protein
MRLSAKGDYALRALMDLSLNYNQRLVQAKEISQHHSIPEKFLEQILRELKNSGIVTAKSGINGGYALSRPPEKITFGEVVRIFEGSLAPIGCVSVSKYQPCPEETFCRFQVVMRRVRDAVADVLDNTTLADVTGTPVAMEESTPDVYFI